LQRNMGKYAGEGSSRELCNEGLLPQPQYRRDKRDWSHYIFCTVDSTEVGNCLTCNGHELSDPVLPVANIKEQDWHSTVASVTNK
jgi:hypothetical protein